jgi:hypothetical protein
MKKILLLLTSTSLLVLPFLVYAQTSAYRPLIQLPVVTGGATGWQGYIDLLYATAISLAALLAVIKIVIAGAKYMFSDVITNKSDAKKDIQGALFGLLLILGAVILLNLINPQLTNTTINISKIDDTPAARLYPPVAPATPATTAPGGTPTTAPGNSTTTPPAQGGGAEKPTPTGGVSLDSRLKAVSHPSCVSTATLPGGRNIMNGSACGAADFTARVDSIGRFAVVCNTNGGRMTYTGTGNSIATCTKT